jgi:hypothetical protein
MMDNVSYQQLRDELLRIAQDVEETPRRRRIARNALEESSRGSGAAAARTPSSAAPGHHTSGNHRGGYFLQAEMEYTGTVER